MALNRVEGDLEVKVTIDNGVVSDAWMIGTMYRGIEKMMVGRAAMDSLVITPRVCGICSTSHLLAAARALENLSGATLPYNGQLLRHLVLAAEKLQNDVRHVALMFAADLTNKKYIGTNLYEEAVRRFEPFRGTSVIEVIRASKKVPEMIAILGGQWPHSSFIVPGGITSEPSGADLRQCEMILDEFRRWYERSILGCNIERWQQVKNVEQLDIWLEESKEHFESDLGFLIRCGREFGLDAMGKGYDSFLAVPEHGLPGVASGGAVTGGVVTEGIHKEFFEEEISEHIRFSRYMGSDNRHVMDSVTQPVIQEKSDKYSLCKAPRYRDHAVETGPLAELMVSDDLLFQSPYRLQPSEMY